MNIRILFYIILGINTMMRVTEVDVSGITQSEIQLEAKTYRKVSKEQMEELTATVYNEANPGEEHSTKPVKKGPGSISFSIPKTWLKEGSSYGIRFKSKSGVSDYDVRWVFRDREFTEKYFSKGEFNRWMQPLWMVIMYTFGTLVILFIYQYMRGCTEQYKKRLREIDEIIRSQAETEGHGWDDGGEDIGEQR